MVCVRDAWLVLGSNTIHLDSPSGGWYCQSLDLGSPTVRTVLDNRPGADGAIDRTTLLGPRTVTAAITVLAAGGVRIDDIADNFAPYMVPSARPVLHYVLDRGTNPERTLTLRGDSYDWPIAGAYQRDVALQWIAADPVARDVATTTVSAVVTTSSAQFSNPGDVPARPVLTIAGPTSGSVTAPWLTFQQSNPSGPVGGYGQIYFVAGYAVPSGHSVVVDCAAHTAYYDNDPTQSVLNQIDWTRTVWPVLPTAAMQSAVPGSKIYFQARGTDASVTAQWSCAWQNGYFV